MKPDRGDPNAGGDEKWAADAVTQTPGTTEIRPLSAGAW